MKKILFSLLFLGVSNSTFIYCVDKNIDDILLNLNRKSHKEMVINKIIQIESEGNPNAVGDSGSAIGLLQIRPIMVKEVNRLLGEQRYTLEDRWCPKKSVEIFKDYQNIVNPEWDEELAAKRWNGGIRGGRNPKTIKYYKKYQAL